MHKLLHCWASLLQVLLPHSCLAAFALSLGELPSTLLLRLTHRESSVCVGVADFVDDHRVLQSLQLPAGGSDRCVA